ncbi:MAG: hypothetical protein ACI8XO_002341 [Verrucomicrobiales bacterium]|jgi:hypothetical protein
MWTHSEDELQTSRLISPSKEDECTAAPPQGQRTIYAAPRRSILTPDGSSMNTSKLKFITTSAFAITIAAIATSSSAARADRVAYWPLNGSTPVSATAADDFIGDPDHGATDAVAQGPSKT